MQPFLLISAIVVSYMCIVQGPCRIRNWVKHGSRQYILSRLRYADSHLHDSDDNQVNLQDSSDKLNDNNVQFYENMLKSYDNIVKIYDNNIKLHRNAKHNDENVKLDDNRASLHDNDVNIYDNNINPHNIDVFEDHHHPREFHGRYREYLRESSCKTPSGATGNCISLYDCPPLMAIINKNPKTSQDLELLKKSQCGYQGNTPKVCCFDDSCFTPDAQRGRCINVQSCSHIAGLLKPPIPQDVLTYVQNSRCEGPDQYSVCCGPPRTEVKPRPVNGVCTLTAAPPDPRSPCCGIDISAEDKITGGEATAVDQYPWMTIIEYVQGSTVKLLCGGALISGKYVLTAAHCVTGPVLERGTPRNVRLSEYDTSNEVTQRDCVAVPGGGSDCTEGVTVIAIEKTIPHPDYNPRNKLRRNDIALIRLRSVAPYTEFIRPICLPTSDIPPTKQRNLTAAGWGAVNETLNKSNIKLHVQLPYVPLDTCQPPYTVPTRNVQLWSGQICAGGVKDKDSCKGDSGGPLMYENRMQKKWEVVGVVSFGPTPCGIENVPGVYTNVFQYMPWIRSQIKP